MDVYMFTIEWLGVYDLAKGDLQYSKACLDYCLAWVDIAYKMVVSSCAHSCDFINVYDKMYTCSLWMGDLPWNVNTCWHVCCTPCLPWDELLFTISAVDDTHVLYDVHHEMPSGLPGVSCHVPHCEDM